MGRCENCKRKIEYNSFVRYRKQILCKPCYKTRLIRKKAKKLEEEEKAKGVSRDISKSIDAITPSFVSDPLAEDEE